MNCLSFDLWACWSRFPITQAFDALHVAFIGEKLYWTKAGIGATGEVLLATAEKYYQNCLSEDLLNQSLLSPGWRVTCFLLCVFLAISHLISSLFTREDVI